MYLKLFEGFNRVSNEKYVEVGMGKMEASAIVKINNARVPHFVFAHCKLLKCNLLNQPFILHLLSVLKLEF
jgi:hypothetical protein